MADYINVSQPIDVAAGTTGAVAFAPTDTSEIWTVRAITLLPNVTTAADATNYATVSFTKGASTTVAADRDTSATALTAKTADNQTISAVGEDKEISNTSPLTVSVAHSGTGATVNVSVLCTFEVMRS